MRKYIAELIGTFVLTAFGCGTAVAANSIFLSMNAAIPVAFTTLLIAFAFGLSVVAMAYSIGNISGCHINPAVSVGMLAAGRMNVKECVGYVTAQCVGALAAALFLWMIFGSRDSLGQNGYGEASTLGLGAGSILILEIVMTFVFVLVVLAVTDRTEFTSAAGLVIGLTLTLIHIFGIPFDGTSVNPARSFGPAIVVGGDALAQLPVFIIAPLIGGVLAALVYRLLFTEAGNPAEEPDTDAEDVRGDDSEVEPDEADAAADGEDAAEEEEREER
ncbi:aquaporin [Hornefia butyriciproducens]|uniref:aquaporin n=1 Tax=Hornefia butyriciproducens TaxID=2652293 RepID=UPI003F89D5A1